MNARKQWLMNEQMHQKFITTRNKMYPPNLQHIDHNLLTQYYLTSIILFFRKRREHSKNFFNVQRLIHTSVCLFKRYYLVNQFRDTEEPAQHAICCIYLSLKLHEYSPDNIVYLAEKWKKKTHPVALFAEKYLHYHEEGYTQKELYFLTNIGFQIGRSPLIQPIQSLYHYIEQTGLLNRDTCSFFLHGIATIQQNVYNDEKCLFLNPGPKLALALVYASLKKTLKQRDIKNLNILQFFNQEVCLILENNLGEVQKLAEMLLELKKIKFTDEQKNSLRNYRALIKKNRPNFEVPPKSPRMSPRSFSSSQI